MSWIADARAAVGGWIAGKFANPAGALGTAVREASTLGPWSAVIAGQFVPLQVNPYLYESLRRAVPPLDAGLDRLITIDGIVEVEGDSDRIVAELQDFVRTVPVNDAQQGLQAFSAGLRNETYEQGYGAGEIVLARDGRGVAGLRVADSKGVRFSRSEKGLEVWYCPPGVHVAGRQDGTDDVQRIIRGTTAFANVAASQLPGFGYKPLDPRTLVYGVRAPEADNPYGTSFMRSVEFVAQILLSIQNSTERVWQRFGDPSFNVRYKTSNRSIDQVELKKRRDELATNLAKALDGKRQGNSVDFVNAIGKDDDIVIEVIGALDQVIEIEMPARHCCEQIAGKLGLPSWMLGFSWNTGNVGEPQMELVLQDSKTRWVDHEPALRRICETYLRSRGRTWKPGDWKLCQRLPNLRDELKAAQAGFLRAQTALMLSGAGDYAGDVDDIPDSPAEPGSDGRGGGQPKAAAIRKAIAEATGPADLAQRLAAIDSGG